MDRFLLCVAGAFLVKEDVALLTIGLGIYVALRHDRRVGLITVCGVAWRHGGRPLVDPPELQRRRQPERLAGPFGGLRGLVTTALLRPWEVVEYAS